MTNALRVIGKAPPALLSRRLRIFDDCAGMGGFPSCLKRSQSIVPNMHVEHVLTCDSNSKRRKFLLQNFTVTDMVTNMLDRRSMGGAPSAGRSCINDRVVALPLNSDFYISTPPCTPFSRRRCAGSFFSTSPRPNRSSKHSELSKSPDLRWDCWKTLWACSAQCACQL